MTVTKVCPRCGEEYEGAIAFCSKDGTRLVTRGQTTDLIGSVIADRYRIVSSIGEGGMGQVYLAEHVRMKRKSAIKIMRRALVGDVEALQRFTREAENASQIAHPNVAAIFDFGETTDGLVYLAMEFVDGYSLAGKLGKDLALHPDVAADILGQAADALQAAHDLGILHRDLKPDNIMLAKRPDGTYMVKLVDFGIARTMDGGDQKVTRTGFAIGTPAYMSPEQLAGDVLDARSDQYSLALVAFMALTGKDAFPAESSKESLIARLTSRPRTLQEAKDDVRWPAALQAIFDRALSPEPTDRFPTVSDFAHALSGAISAMTPTQTAELYRRALDIRIANVAMRTPHSDLQALRTPNSAIAALTPPGAQPTVEGAADTRGMPAASGAYAPIGSGAYAPLGSGTYPPVGSGSYAPVGAPTETGAAPAAPAKEKRRAPILAIAATVVALVAAGSMLMKGNDSAAPAAADTLAAVPGGPITDSVPSVVVNTAPVGASTASGLPGAAPALSAAQQDSVTLKAQNDSLARIAKFKADSTKRRAQLVAQFPQRAATAMVGADVRVREDYTLRPRDEIRVTIMPPQVVAWRDSRAKKWKEANMRPNLGVPYDIVDPIEVWGSWNSIVRSRRAVYVLEVGPEKAPWPSLEPEKLSDIKRGDIGSVKLLRDGAEVALGNMMPVPALVNEDAHVKAGRRVPAQVQATLPPDTFTPRPDGTMPKFEVVVVDRVRNNTVRLEIPNNVAGRLWDDFKPYRDALDAPFTMPAAPAPKAGAAALTKPVTTPKS